MSATRDCDVVVLGGGLAGLSAALQLKQARPQTSVVLAEKREHPVPETAFKVGESVAEIGSHYLKVVIGQEDHMENEQLRKFSLRLFSSAGGNTDISRRPEIGLHRFSPLRTYQIDRGRLENHLVGEVADAGVELLDGHTVNDFALGEDRHTVSVRRNGHSEEVHAKWIVDASGRAGILRRGLRLGTEIPHDVNACWFRIPERLCLDEWSDDPAWQARVPSRSRWMSTNQLVGKGYWIWLIPLASGAMSVGLVADPEYVPYESIRRYDALYEWLRANEPQLAARLPSDESGLMDFRKLKKYAYGTRRGLSPQRWCLTGEAGLFLDPLYSTGVDFIAVANSLSTRLICSALDGEPDGRRRLKAFNAYYLGQFLGWSPAFSGQYKIFGDGQITAAKVMWDNAQYFMFPVLLYIKDCITDHDFMATVRLHLMRAHQMTLYMQRCFRELSGEEYDVRAAGFPVASDAAVEDLFQNVLEPMDTQEVAARIEQSVSRLHILGTDLATHFYEACGRKPPPIDYDPPATSERAEDLLTWSTYAQRTDPPSQVAPQPEGSWMLR